MYGKNSIKRGELIVRKVMTIRLDVGGQCDGMKCVRMQLSGKLTFVNLSSSHVSY